jgi:hypothetical protein
MSNGGRAFTWAMAWLDVHEPGRLRRRPGPRCTNGQLVHRARPTVHARDDACLANRAHIFPVRPVVRTAQGPSYHQRPPGPAFSMFTVGGHASLVDY